MSRPARAPRTWPSGPRTTCARRSRPVEGRRRHGPARRSGQPPRPAHALAAALVTELGRDLVVPHVEIDARFADLDLGLADCAVMACAERHRLPILTFDFTHFGAAPPATGHWRLIVDESRYAAAARRQPK